DERAAPRLAFCSPRARPVAVGEFQVSPRANRNRAHQREGLASERDLAQETWPADLASRLGQQTWPTNLANRLGQQTWTGCARTAAQIGPAFSPESFKAMQFSA